MNQKTNQVMDLMNLEERTNMKEMIDKLLGKKKEAKKLSEEERRAVQQKKKKKLQKASLGRCLDTSGNRKH